MSLIAGIRTTLRGVVGSAGGLGEAWWYRTITTPPTAQTKPGYSVWAQVDAVVTGQHVADVPDPRTGKLSQRNRQFFRITDTLALPLGSQVSPDKATIWAVDELVDGKGGTARYLIGRDPIERLQGNRGGGP